MGQLTYATKTDTIAVSGTASAGIELEDFEILGLDIPALDSTTLKIQGSVDGGGTYRDVYDGTGTQVLSHPASTGNRVIAARDLMDLIGCTHAKIVCGSAQNSLARTFTWRVKVPQR